MSNRFLSAYKNNVTTNVGYTELLNKLKTNPTKNPAGVEIYGKLFSADTDLGETSSKISKVQQKLDSVQGT